MFDPPKSPRGPGWTEGEINNAFIPFSVLSINDELYVDYDIEVSAKADSYQVVSTDASGDIIVKLVNVTGYPKTFAISVAGSTIADTAEVQTVAGTSLKDDNILGKEEVVTLKTSSVSGLSDNFNYTVGKYSVTVLRLKTK